MRIVFDSSFKKSAKKLPVSIDVHLARQIDFLIMDMWHPLLHTKQLLGSMQNYYSFRVTREWRVLFYIERPKTIHLLLIEHRKDIYRQ